MKDDRDKLTPYIGQKLILDKSYTNESEVTLVHKLEANGIRCFID